MEIRSILRGLKGDGEIIAGWGRAELVKHSNGTYELRGGSAEDHTAAQEWISLFMHEIVVRSRPTTERR